MSANVSKIDVVLNAAEARQEAARVEQSMQGIAKSAQTAGVQASAGLSQVEAATAGTARSAAVLEKEIAANQRIMAQLRVAIAENRNEMLGLTLAMKSFEDQGKKDSVEATNLATRMELLDIETKQLVTSFGLLNAETGQMRLQLKGVSPVLDDTAEKAAFTTRQTVQLAAGASRLAGAAIPGARAIGVLAGSFSLAAIPQLALIVGIGILVGELLKLFKSKGENAVISDALIKSDSALAVIFDRMAAAAGGTNSALTGQAANFKQLLSLDFASALNSYLVAYEKLAPEIEKSKDAESGRIAAEKLLRQVETEAADALKNHAGNYGELKQSIDIASASLEFQKNRLNDSTTARDKESAEVEKHALALIKLGQETGRSTEEIRAQVAALYNGANAADHFAALVLKAADAQYQLNAAVRDFHPVALNTGAQAGIVRQMQEGLAKDIAGGASLAQVEPRIKALQKAAAELASSEAAARGEALSFNDAHQRTRQIMLDDFGALASYVDKLPVYEKNLSNATAAKESHGRASHAAAQAMRDENVILQMQVELLHAQQRLGKENFNQEADLTVQEFKIKEQSFISKARLQKFSDDQIKQGIAIIRQLELAAIDEISQKEAESIRKRAEEESRYLTHQRTERERMVKEYEHNVNVQEKLERDFTETVKEEETKRAVAIIKGATRAIAAQQAREVAQVTAAFGRASNSAHVFQLQLLALQRFNRGDFFGGLRASLQAVIQDMAQSGQMAQSMADLLEGAFSRSIASGDGFLRTLGASLIQGMTDIVAQVLRQIGVMLISKGIADVLMGIAINSNPFTVGLGTALIHAGTAEIVEGGLLGIAAGVVSGLGGLAANSIKGNQAAGANGGAGAGTSNSTGNSAPVNNGPIPRLISFPTSGPLSSGDLHIHLSADRAGRVLKDILVDGHGVITHAELSNPMSPASRKVKKLAKVS